MNLQQWRQDPTLISKAGKLQDSPAFKAMQEVLNNELPTNHVLPVGVNGTDFAYHYGMEIGYRRALGVIKAMAQPSPVEHEDLEATFTQPLEQ